MSSLHTQTTLISLAYWVHTFLTHYNSTKLKPYQFQAMSYDTILYRGSVDEILTRMYYNTFLLLSRIYYKPDLLFTGLVSKIASNLFEDSWNYSITYCWYNYVSWQLCIFAIFWTFIFLYILYIDFHWIYFLVSSICTTSFCLICSFFIFDDGPRLILTGICFCSGFSWWLLYSI